MDAWVVEVLREGYRILFSRRPPLSDQPLPMLSYSPSSKRGKALEQEFQDLLHKQAIEQAPQTPGFYSRLFVVQKDSRAWRPIIDLSTLNTYIASQRFHMETPQSVLRSIRPGDWMISLDLQDAYLQVPVHPESRRYLRFTMGGVSLSVQGAVLRVDNCPSGLYTADGSNIRHSPSLRYQDAQIPRRLVDSSRIQDHLSPGEGQAPASVRGAGTTSQFQEVVLHPISGHDLSRHAEPVSSVHCQTDRDKGRKSPQYHRGVSFLPGPPSNSLASSSGPPFVPYSSGEGWDVKDAVSPDSPQVQVGLPRRIASHPLGSSVSGGSFVVVLGDSKMRGRRSFSPRARLELLLGRVRRRLGRHRRGTASVRSLDSKPEGTLHQPQGDDGSAERPLRVQTFPQRQDDRSLLRQCHDSRLPQAIGRHEVSGPVPQSKKDSPVGGIHEDHATSPVHPGVSQHESGSSQSAQPGDRIGVDTTPGGSPRSSPPVAGDHRPVRDLADSKAPSVLCSSVGTQGSGGRCLPPALGQSSGVCLSSHSHHKESSSQTESLSQLQSDSHRPLLASKGMVSRSAGTSIPNVEICCDNRISIGFTKISLCFV